MGDASWRDYQARVAAAFEALGLDTVLEGRMRGARSDHVVDVVARFEHAGVRQLWLVECKAWNRPVSKEAVLTFRGVVEDVGADRGFLVAEGGFQPAARRAADRTSVTLTSLDAFVAATRRDVAEARLTRLQARLEAVENRMYDLPPKAMEQPKAWEKNARLMAFLLQDGFQDARRRRLPLRVPWDLRGFFNHTADITTFLDDVECIVDGIEAWRDELGESPQEQIERLVHESGFRAQFLECLADSLVAPRESDHDPRPSSWRFERVASLGTPVIHGLYHPGGIGLTVFEVSCDVVVAGADDAATQTRSRSGEPDVHSLMIRADVAIELATSEILTFKLSGVEPSPG